MESGAATSRYRLIFKLVNPSLRGLSPMPLPFEVHGGEYSFPAKPTQWLQDTAVLKTSEVFSARVDTLVDIA